MASSSSSSQPASSQPIDQELINSNPATPIELTPQTSDDFRALVEEDPIEEDSEEDPEEDPFITAQDFANYTQSVDFEFSEMRRAASAIDGLTEDVNSLKGQSTDHERRITINRAQHVDLADLVLSMRHQLQVVTHNMSVLRREHSEAREEIADLRAMLAAAQEPPPQPELPEEPMEEESEGEEEGGEEAEEDAASDMTSDSESV